MADISTEIAEIEQLQRDDNVSYWKSDLPDRYGELIAAKEAGTPAPAGPSANDRRIAEIEGLMSDTYSEYWRGPKADILQREYRDLIDGGQPASEVAEALGISEDMASDMQARVGSAFESIDTGALDSAFEGLSDEAQGIASAVLADPSKREAYIETMPVETLEELVNFVGRMPDNEVAALERALLL